MGEEDRGVWLEGGTGEAGEVGIGETALGGTSMAGYGGVGSWVEVWMRREEF